jgi:hypothetical protein
MYMPHAKDQAWIVTHLFAHCIELEGMKDGWREGRGNKKKRKEGREGRDRGTGREEEVIEVQVKREEGEGG